MKKLLLSILTAFGLFELAGCGGTGIEAGFAEAPPVTIAAPPAAEKPTAYKAASTGPQAAERPAKYR